jgi:hypothetical protein
MIAVDMDKDEILQALRGLLKEPDDTIEPGDVVYYNAGIIDAIKEVEKLYHLQKMNQSQNSVLSYRPDAGISFK